MQHKTIVKRKKKKTRVMYHAENTRVGISRVRTENLSYHTTNL